MLMQLSRAARGGVADVSMCCQAANILFVPPLGPWTFLQCVTDISWQEIELESALWMPFWRDALVMDATGHCCTKVNKGLCMS